MKCIMESVVRQGHVAKIIRDLCGEAHAAQGQPNLVANIVSLAGRYSSALYHDLETSTRKPVVSSEMESRRGVPSDPAYFEEIGPIEEFVESLEDLGTSHD